MGQGVESRNFSFGDVSIFRRFKDVPLNLNYKSSDYDIRIVCSDGSIDKYTILQNSDYLVIASLDGLHDISLQTLYSIGAISVDGYMTIQTKSKSFVKYFSKMLSTSLGDVPVDVVNGYDDIDTISTCRIYIGGDSSSTGSVSFPLTDLNILKAWNSYRTKVVLTVSNDSILICNDKYIDDSKLILKNSLSYSSLDFMNIDYVGRILSVGYYELNYVDFIGAGVSVNLFQFFRDNICQFEKVGGQ